MSEIRLVAFDLDGTAIPMCGFTPSDRFCECVIEGARRGVIFAPFTGRTITTIPERIMKLPCIRYVSYANGAGIYDCAIKSYIYHSLMSIDTCISVLRYLEPYDLPVLVFSDGFLIIEQRIYDNPKRYPLLPHHRRSVDEGTSIVVPNMEQYLLEKRPNVDKINIVKVIGEPRAKITADLSKSDKIYTVSSGGTNLEINAVGTNKGNALRFLADHLGIDIKNVMALGDNDNDIEMLETAGFGIAVKNASENAKAAADFITESQEMDGAAIAIERFILEGV